LNKNNHFIEDIKITKFKCFNDFEASNLKRVNLIGGENNIGKTAFMEAMYLYVSENMVMTYQRLLTLKTYRDMQTILLSNEKDEDILKSLILEHQDICIGLEDRLNYVQEDFLEGDLISSHQSISIFKINKNEDTGLFSSIVKSELIFHKYFARFDNDGEEYRRYEESSKKYSLSQLIKILHSSMPNVRYSTSRAFIGANLNDNNLLEKIIGDLKLNNNYNALNTHLKSLFDIENIDFINKVPMVKIHDKYHKLTTLGDGVKSIIFYLGSLLTLKDNYIFIDEIENGIHYSKLDDIWELILTISKEQNIQIFATTHSKECIESYARVFTKLKDEDVNFLTLYKNEDNVLRSISLGYEKIQNSIKIKLDNR